MPEKWDLLFTLPNLSPPVPTPYEDEEKDLILCSSKDERLGRLADNKANATALKMLKKFRTHRNERYAPGCLLVRSPATPQLLQAEALRAFRNICAITTTTSAHSLGLHAPHAVQWNIHWSDQFLFGYFVSGKSGAVITLQGASRGMDHVIPRFQPAAQFSNPESWLCRVDRQLLIRLLVAWRRCYLRQRPRKLFRRLFRSLEVAFHASLFPSDGLNSLNDTGTRLALWVSALEVLCHPGGKVNKRVVQGVLRNAPYEFRRLLDKTFVVYESQSKPRVKATLPEALYDDLYWARNQFLHGNAVNEKVLHYRKSEKFYPLNRIAPVLYSAALVSFLDEVKIPGGPMPYAALDANSIPQFFASREGFRQIQKGLIAAATVHP